MSPTANFQPVENKGPVRSGHEPGCQVVCGQPAPQGAVEGPFVAATRREKGRALWWSVGGTVLSGVGFICLALFEQYNSSLSELRSDLKHFNEISGELVRKESLHKCIDHLIECKKELHAVLAAKAELDHELAVVRKDREELARQLQALRERMASVEGRQSATPIVVIPQDKLQRATTRPPVGPVTSTKPSPE
jgi:hypothetical protein